MISNLKAVFFDVDDTLLDHAAAERQALMHVFRNIDIEYKASYHEIFRPLDFALWNGTYQSADPIPKDAIPIYRFTRLFEIIGVQYDNPAKANDLFKEGLVLPNDLMEHAAEAVEHVHDKGLPVCIVTNGLISLQKPRVLNSGVGKYISDNHIMVSEEAGAQKPDPFIFNLLLKKIGMAPQDVVMIGDKLQLDIKGAQNAGIRSIWYNSACIENETDITPDYEIHDWLEIKKII
ncbi:MAG: YjjG family noncanonical pyrimidine nucleotidase [Defluviitaleaceae bacterium]|nr:YjjG family noncanonical pyrimidine nucleotidase [Defluviitaleaceae bacterium]